MEQGARIKPPMEHDNAWWWELAASGVLAIQRCSNCSKLRHPPRPMCDSCQSLEWDHIESTGNGVVASYTVLNHPRFPGYEYPLNMALIDLEEGERITSQLVDCDPDDIKFGMSVKMKFHRDPDGFTMPVFYPA